MINPDVNTLIKLIIPPQLLGMYGIYSKQTQFSFVLLTYKMMMLEMMNYKHPDKEILNFLEAANKDIIFGEN